VSDQLIEKAVTQIRDSLATLSFAADGFYEDEAQVSLDALDWIEERLLQIVDAGRLIQAFEQSGGNDWWEAHAKLYLALDATSGARQGQPE
jgi:hypothetical protein